VAGAGFTVHLFDRLDIDAVDIEPAITIHSSTPVWGLFPSWQIAASRGTEPVTVDVDAVLLANGSIDRVVPVAGSTLPGVITASGLMQLIDRWRLLPGKRFVILGDGPEATGVAGAIARAGGEIARIEPASSVPSLEIVGADGVTGVRRGDDLIDADIVVMAAGQLPDLSLAAMAGCDMVFDNDARHWRLDIAADGRTSVPGIWAAGSVAGSADPEASGRLAGESIVAALTAGLPALDAPSGPSGSVVRQPWRYDQRIGAGSER
jgi:pyruvate/2-oxoglutarate dehydrogenase complex dihydrolipoamide dehydrogenase (E3) component